MPFDMGTLKQALTQGLGLVIGAILLAAISGVGGAVAARWGAVTVPRGAVVAFDLEGACPDGWRPHELSAGRFIRGVDSNPERNPATLFRGEGGGRNLDGVQYKFLTADSGITAFVYAKEPDRLPPYITLQFCTPGN